jgi:hypothetical protein
MELSVRGHFCYIIVTVLFIIFSRLHNTIVY